MANSSKHRRRVEYTKNLETRIEGTKLHIAIELDSNKIATHTYKAGDTTFLSVYTGQVWYQSKPLMLSLSVRTIASRRGVPQ